MREVKVFAVVIRGEHRVEADDSNQAIQRTIAYFSQHLDELDKTWTEETAYVENEGGQ